MGVYCVSCFQRSRKNVTYLCLLGVCCHRYIRIIHLYTFSVVFVVTEMNQALIYVIIIMFDVTGIEPLPLVFGIYLLQCRLHLESTGYIR